ncbi:MAG: hypothetical protein MK185_04720 [Saccharospirillaceae bacterium]|jgi:hypothetical protein|nr:hypothetical protein [Saccharospirillaceae bacterium]
MTHNEKMLAAIQARLEKRVVADHESYSIDGKSLNRIPFEQLVKYEQVYAVRVAREQRKAAGKKAPRRIIHRMY